MTTQGISNDDVAVPWGSIRERFDEVAAAHGDLVAVVCGEEQITYRDLASRTTELAGGLTHCGEGPIALDTDSSLDCVLAIVAVLVSGRPLVLLDSQLPEERRAAITAQARAQRLSPHALPAPAKTELPAVHESDCAVILFTSGSTGAPKSVIQGQRMWLNQGVDFHRTLNVGVGDRIGMALPISFGGGMDVVMHALLNGATLDVRDPREHGIGAVPQWITVNQLTTLHATPSLLRKIVAECQCVPDLHLPHLRLVTTCGEAIHGRDVGTMRAVLGEHVDFCNLSGSSETGNLAFFLLLSGTAVPDRILPVGTPATNKNVQLLGDDGQPVTNGEIGEVFVESRYIAEGYRTGEASRFVDLGDGLRRYHTGDLGRLDSDGILHLVGRSDDAVKIRGYLVEVAEIETAIRAHPGVYECAVLARKAEGSGDADAIAVFYVGEQAISAPQLRTHLAERLPSWMMPTHLVALDALPRTERGKVDRAQLSIPEHARNLESSRTPIEVEVAVQWALALGLDTVGRREDPFVLGADSLALHRVLAALAERYGTRVPVGVALADPSPAGIASRISSPARRSSLPPTAVMLDLGEQPLWAFCGAGGNTSSFVPLARELAGEFSTFAVQQRGLESRALPDFTVTRMVDRHLATILRQQPRGPYRLVGHSLGGLLALETARLLTSLGRAVESLTILDTILPGSVVAQHVTMSADDLRERLVATEEHRAVPSLRDRLRTHWQVYSAGLIRRDPVIQEKVFWELGLRVGNRHHAGVWDGDATVYLTADNSDDPAWWASLVTGNLDTIRVPGDHLSVVRQPIVADVANRIRAAASHPTG